jgi:hypothetical protein
VNKEQVPKIIEFVVAWERKEEQVNKEYVQEIVLLQIVVQDESTKRKKEVRVHKDLESTNDDDDSASKRIFF